MRHFKSSISDEDFGVYCKKPFKKESGRVTYVDFDFSTFVGCDKEGSCCAFSVYNASDKFGLIIGDSIAVPEPHIIDVKITSEESGCENFDFRIVRIVNPLKMLRNGKPVKMDCVAFCKVVADFVY
uniref:TTC5_OB domain-containing protein n=1 Tax=Loa loa TaxID=7209 RepID=A0A1I7VSS5_LOALO